METFVLDANIVIKVWAERPQIFDAIEQTSELDCRVMNDVVLELLEKDGTEFFPEMSPRYQQLMRHLVHSPGFLPEKPYKENRFLSKQRDDIKVVIANKVSSTDFLQVLLCQNNPEFMLVTEDTKVLKSAKRVLPESRVLDYKRFLDALAARGVNGA